MALVKFCKEASKKELSLRNSYLVWSQICMEKINNKLYFLAVVVVVEHNQMNFCANLTNTRDASQS
jgi:hypothetical protein